MAFKPHESGTNSEMPHFVLVPMLAQGHMIPMVDMAGLLATRGALVSLVTTPVNASRIKPITDRMEESGLTVRVVTLRFACAEVGLPEGCESLDAVPSRDFLPNFIKAIAMLQEPLVARLREQHPSPSCIISDVFLPWAREVGQEFAIPSLAFHGFGCFALLIRHIIHFDKIFESTTSDDEPIVVPGLPLRVEITRVQAPRGPGLKELRDKMMEVEATADGIVVNSFDELEPSYRELYHRTVGRKVWTIGPLSLCNTDVADMAVRGKKASIDEQICLSWLDSMEPSSVLYVSFGSLARTTLSQMIEIGLGLEASNCPFIWVIKAGGKASEVEEWLSKGFEERTRARGLIIRGWAPQVMILSHRAVGGFMTHCGWNSTLEGVSAGVPLITWPHFGEQFLNEKLIAEVLRIGVAVGVKHPEIWGMRDDRVMVKRVEVEKAVMELMRDGEEREERRQRTRELGGKARKAMEPGGSSYEHLTNFIKHLTNFINYPQANLHGKEE